MPNILLIDDDIELCAMLSEYMGMEHFNVSTIHNGQEGIEAALSNPYDVIILDVMLPGADGFTVLQSIRKQSQTPVLMLTAKGDDIDRIVGLEMGADDYLPKPCNPRELVARIKAILRRTQNIVPATQNSQTLQSGDISINSSARQAYFQNETLALTSTEYNLLEVLIQSAGNVVSKEELSEQAMGRKLTRYDRSIDMHLSKLRQKLNDKEQNIIKTIRGMGYQLCEGV